MIRNISIYSVFEKSFSLKHSNSDCCNNLSIRYISSGILVNKARQCFSISELGSIIFRSIFMMDIISNLLSCGPSNTACELALFLMDPLMHLHLRAITLPIFGGRYPAQSVLGTSSIRGIIWAAISFLTFGSLMSRDFARRFHHVNNQWGCF